MTQSDGYGPGQEQDQPGHQGQPGHGRARWYGAEPSQYPGADYPANPYPSGAYPPGPYSSGAYPPGPYPSGGYPSGGYGTQRYQPVNPAMRAATADRERTVDVLKAAFAEGRLSQEEYNDRMGRAYSARTYGELMALTADLPAGPLPVPSQPGWRPVPATRTNSMAIAAMVLGIAEFPTAGLTAIPAIICGHVARREIRETGEQGAGMAAVGLVLGYGALILGMIMVVALIAFATANGAHPVFPGPPGG